MHGWKHNEKTKDRSSFFTLIEELNSQSESPNFIGVYIAWNGNLGLPGFVENLSFWNRKNTADEIGQSATLSDVIGRLNSILSRHEKCALTNALSTENTSCLYYPYDTGHKEKPNNNSAKIDNNLVLIGHSFGARILQSSVTQGSLHQALANQKPLPDYGGPYEKIEGVADLIIYLNPAFEASIYRHIEGLRRTKNSIQIGQQPVIVSLSSQNDKATKFAFPMGQLVGRHFNEKKRTTLGNYKNYVSHTLTLNNPSDCIEDKTHWYDGWEKDTKMYVLSSSKSQDKHTADIFEEIAGEKNHYCLQRRTNGIDAKKDQPGNPFLVVSTTKEVIGNHNDIWDPSLREWLASFFFKSIHLEKKQEVKTGL